MLARCNRDLKVFSCNIVTPSGRRVCKDQHMAAGETLPMVREYVSDSLAVHGERVVVLARRGYHLHALARDFDLESAGGSP